MKKNFIFILIFFLILSNFSLANDITIKKTKNHHLTPKPTKKYFMVDNEIVRAGKQSQNFFYHTGYVMGKIVDDLLKEQNVLLIGFTNLQENMESHFIMLGAFIFQRNLQVIGQVTKHF